MSSNKMAGRQLQILPSVHESLQLDLLSFVSDHVAELSVKEKQTRGVLPKNSVIKTSSYHFYGNVDVGKSFSTFCVGKSNQFAVEAVKRFLSNGQSDFSIIYLKAASGLGKSHILHAVANEMSLTKKSFYFSSPLMMSSLVDTFSTLRFYDILLIDDIEEIEGNTELQKVFCQLMDFAQTGKIKLIITGIKLPKDLKACDDRMKGKLSAALIHQIDGINSDLAFDIVELKSKKLCLGLPLGVKRLVSNQLGFNVYAIESLLYKLKSISDISDCQITMEMALNEIKDKTKIYRTDEYHLLLNAVAANFEISIEEISSSVRKKEFALARHVAMFLLKEKKRLNVMKIAELFERDHSSVVYAISRIKNQIENDMEMKSRIQILLNQV